MKEVKENKGHGFLPDRIKPEDYVFGGLKLSGEILQPTGQWGEFLPAVELQARNGLETMNCTVYGTLNCLEVLLKRLFPFSKQDACEPNFSERYIGVMAETSRYGNSPQKVIETIRKKAGLIGEHLLPFRDSIITWDEYYSPNPMTKDYIKMGNVFLKDYKIGHEWVEGGAEVIKEALKRSPLGVSVNLSNRCQNENSPGYLLYDKRDSDNHWVMLYGYKEGEYWKIFDHYDNVFKKMTWDYGFEFIKRYSLEKVIKKLSLCQRLLRGIINYFKDSIKWTDKK